MVNKWLGGSKKKAEKQDDGFVTLSPKFTVRKESAELFESIFDTLHKVESQNVNNLTVIGTTKGDDFIEYFYTHNGVDYSAEFLLEFLKESIVDMEYKPNDLGKYLPLVPALTSLFNNARELDMFLTLGSLLYGLSNRRVYINFYYKQIQIEGNLPNGGDFTVSFYEGLNGIIHKLLEVENHDYNSAKELLNPYMTKFGFEPLPELD